MRQTKSSKIMVHDLVSGLNFLLVERSIDIDRYIHNLGRLGFVEALDAKYGPFS
jgi:hypothetical protein